MIKVKQATVFATLERSLKYNSGVVCIKEKSRVIAVKTKRNRRIAALNKAVIRRLYFVILTSVTRSGCKMRVRQGNRALPGVQPVSHATAVKANRTVMARESHSSLRFSSVSMRRYTVFLSSCAGFSSAVYSLYSKVFYEPHGQGSGKQNKNRRVRYDLGRQRDRRIQGRISAGAPDRRAASCTYRSGIAARRTGASPRIPSRICPSPSCPSGIVVPRSYRRPAAPCSCPRSR